MLNLGLRTAGNCSACERLTCSILFPGRELIGEALQEFRRQTAQPCWGPVFGPHLHKEHAYQHQGLANSQCVPKLSAGLQNAASGFQVRVSGASPSKLKSLVMRRRCFRLARCKPMACAVQRNHEDGNIRLTSEWDVQLLRTLSNTLTREAVPTVQASPLSTLRAYWQEVPGAGDG